MLSSNCTKSQILVVLAGLSFAQPQGKRLMVESFRKGSTHIAERTHAGRGQAHKFQPEPGEHY